MIKVGLIGEDPNDTLSITNLFLQKFEGRVSFYQILKNIKGYNLDNPKVKDALEIEYKSRKPDWVLFIRDADGIITENEAIQKREIWFNQLLPSVDNKGFLLLNIYELEALILADIDMFNKIYGTSIKYTKNVMYQSDPKGFLKEKTFKNKKRYSESDCPNVFKKIRFDTVAANCKYLNEFILKFKMTLQLN